jgi:alpha-beta hydrolase superfamily lysophospholipase
VVAVPTWVSVDDTMLAGWVHQSTGMRANGGVVLCPPIGREGIVTYQAMRILASRLAADGLVALRIDYAGTGDSCDPEHVSIARWQRDIRGAVAFLRSAGCGSVSLVGLRMGATLAAAAAGDCGSLASLVLWDPVLAGRSFLREQRALQTMEIGPQPVREDGSEEALGFIYTAALASEIRALDLDPAALSSTTFDDADCRPCLLLTRPEYGSQPAIQMLADLAVVKQLPAPAQAELLGHRSFASIVPQATVSDIARHVSARTGTRACQLTLSLRNSAVVGATSSGEEIVEHFTRLGQRDAFAVVTEVRSTAPRPVLMCTNVAAEHHIGPGRAWVGLARRAAARGLVAIRFDSPGVGDSVQSERYEPAMLYATGEISMTADIVRAVAAQYQAPVGMLGSCSGAWVAAATSTVVNVDAVWLINQARWSRSPKPIDGRDAEATIERYVEEGTQPATMSARARRFVQRHLPYRVWLVLCHAGIASTPEVLLRDITGRGTKVRLLLSTEDAASFDQRRGSTGVARLRQRGTDIRASIFDTDHALFMESGRTAVLSMVLEDAAHDLCVGSSTSPSYVDVAR